MKYRKKPVEITAHQWLRNGDHPDDYTEDLIDPVDGRVWTAEQRRAENWEGAVVRYFRHPDIPGDQTCSKCELPMDAHGWIDTLEDGHNVCPGDWIVTGVEGERYPVKPSVFEATYEPVPANVNA
ncbi:hypothetical protein [Streptomonospora arabica]|uniref:Uncharacterized protein n=1 Tax=Streptomonospora arabica TaxID=412417 RepID=A0ABV9SSJ5_9ACTN